MLLQRAGPCFHDQKDNGWGHASRNTVLTLVHFTVFFIDDVSFPLTSFLCDTSKTYRGEGRILPNRGTDGNKNF